MEPDLVPAMGRHTIQWFKVKDSPALLNIKKNMVSGRTFPVLLARQAHTMNG